jgi:hypothetical protein
VISVTVAVEDAMIMVYVARECLGTQEEGKECVSSSVNHALVSS